MSHKMTNGSWLESPELVGGEIEVDREQKPQGLVKLAVDLSRRRCPSLLNNRSTSLHTSITCQSED